MDFGQERRSKENNSPTEARIDVIYLLKRVNQASLYDADVFAQIFVEGQIGHRVPRKGQKSERF